MLVLESNSLFQNVEISHAINEELKSKINSALGMVTPLLGPDGRPMKTSVCDQIKESVERAEEIEKQIANAKVI